MRTHEGHRRAVLGRALSRSRPAEARAELEHALELIADDYVAVERLAGRAGTAVE